MPRYDFKCKQCKTVHEVELSVLEYESKLNLDCLLCGTGPHERVMNIPSIGAVPGGGGSPAR